MEQSEQRNSSIPAGDLPVVPASHKPSQDQEKPNAGSSNRWNCLSGCLFDYSGRASIDQSRGNRHLQSSIILKQDNSNSQLQSRMSDTTSTQNEEQKAIVERRNSQNREQIQQQVANPLSVKQDNNQSPPLHLNHLHHHHHEAASGSMLYSYDGSGMNSPIETHNNGNMPILGLSKITQNQSNFQNDSSKLMACSLDASNIETLQRMIERKQVINHKEQQTLNQLVNQYLPGHGNIFILRDKLNQYNTLASVTYKPFTIHGAAPAYSSITQSVFQSQTIPMNNNTSSIITNASNANNTTVTSNLNGTNTSHGNNNSNRAATVIANTNALLKAPAQQRDSQQQQQQQLQQQSQQPQQQPQLQQQQLLQAQLVNPDFLSFKYLYSKPLKLDLDYHDMFTPEKIALHIADQFKKYTLIIDACCGIGGNTIQFSKVNKMVIAVDRNPRALANCVENVKLYRPERNVNVEYICQDFLKIPCSDYCALRADLVFIHPHIELSSDPTIKPDLFKHSQPNILKAMRHAYKISKNFAVLLPNSIDILQIPILMDRFYRSLPAGMISHHCPHIEVMYLNGGVKYFLLTVGEVQKYKQDDEFQFMQSLIQLESYYPKGGAYEQCVLELLHTVERKIGMKKLVNSLIKSIDSNDLDTQKNLLKKFVDEMQREKILTNQETKKILNVGDNASAGQQQQNQFENNLLNIDGMLSHSPRLQTQSHSMDNSSNNINFNNFDMSVTSQVSNFVLDMQYGSKQSQDFNPISPSQMLNKEKSLSYDRNQSKASLFPLIDSTLGDKKDLEEEDDYGFEDEYDDEDGENGNDRQKQNNDGRSNLDDDFYFNEHHNNDLMDQKKPFPFNPHNQLNTL